MFIVINILLVPSQWVVSFVFGFLLLPWLRVDYRHLVWWVWCRKCIHFHMRVDLVVKKLVTAGLSSDFTKTLTRDGLLLKVLGWEHQRVLKYTFSVWVLLCLTSWQSAVEQKAYIRIPWRAWIKYKDHQQSPFVIKSNRHSFNLPWPLYDHWSCFCKTLTLEEKLGFLTDVKLFPFNLLLQI